VGLTTEMVIESSLFVKAAKISKSPALPDISYYSRRADYLFFTAYTAEEQRRETIT
jgi:hypothetical protein